jgi:hypothetical protein
VLFVHCDLLVEIIVIYSPNDYRPTVELNPPSGWPAGRAGKVGAVKLLYKPFGLILGILAGLIGKRAFDFAWTKIDDEDPPKGTTQRAPWVKILAAAALQGVIFKTVRVTVDRYGAIGWHYLTGSWPGEKRPDPDED